VDTHLQSVRTPLLETAYLTAGPDSGFPVVLIHGWPDDARTWDRVTEAMAAAGLRTIAPYLRGFGPTRFLDGGTPRSGQLSALGQDLIDFVAALRLDRFALVGHDWGARAAAIATTELQAGGRVTHLVMLSVGYGTNDPGQALPLRQIQNYWYHWYLALPRGADLVRSHRRELTRYMWDIWGAPGWTIADDEFDLTAESFENPDWAEIVLSSYRHRWGHAEGDPQYAPLERRLNPAPIVAVPTLVLHGEADPCNNPITSAGKERYFSSRYARKLLAGVGHFPQREAAEAVGHEILAWLNR